MKSRRDHAAPPSGDGPIFAALIALLVWLPLPAGSHSQVAAHLDGAAIFLLLALWAVQAARGKVQVPPLWRLRWVFALWLAWLAWLAFQLLPLSPEPLAQWSPASAAAQQTAARTADAPVWGSITLSPSASMSALLSSAALAGLYLLTILCVRSTARARTVLVALVVSGLFEAAYGALMTMSGAEYGFFVKKSSYLGFATGTFINRNHLAGYLELCGAAAVALVLADLGGGAALDWRARARKLVELAFSAKFRVRVCLAVMVVGVVLTQSRMGNTAFFSALTASGLIYVLLRERRYFLPALLLFASFFAVDLLIVHKYFGLEKVVQRIESTDVMREGRVTLLEEIMPALPVYARSGAGLGAFIPAYMPYRDADNWQFFDHAHNDYVEFLIEVGLPGAALLAVLAGVHMLHALRVLAKRKRRSAAAAVFAGMMGLIALAIHAAVEFNLQIPAISATLVVLMAVGARTSEQSRRRRRHSAAAPEGEGPQDSTRGLPAV